jgi:putative molybdopterin biosynthesis protein
MKLLRIPEVARILGMSEDRIYALCRENILPHARFGRQIRISEQQLDGFIASGGKALPGGWRREAL